MEKQFEQHKRAAGNLHTVIVSGVSYIHMHAKTSCFIFLDGTVTQLKNSDSNHSVNVIEIIINTLSGQVSGQYVFQSSNICRNILHKFTKI